MARERHQHRGLRGGRQHHPLTPNLPFHSLRGSSLAWLGLAGLLSFGVGERSAFALDRRTDAAAKQAMTLAAKDHAASDDDGALIRLQRAMKACGGARCAASTRGALARDTGAIQFARGEHQKASIAFGQALDLDADLPWNAAYDAKDMVAEWAAVKDERAALHEALPEGDFEHAPESEQAVDTPLPIYAETSVPGVARVVIKYRVPGETELRRRTLRRFGGGWGGLIPCEFVKRGLLRYFLQAFDADGAPLGNSGDVKHTYFVPIRWAIGGEPPHLPGRPPPESCAGGHPKGEEEATPSGEASAPGSEDRYVHFWIGISGSIDLTTVPSGSDVCALTPAGAPVNTSFYCTNPDGSDFPRRAAANGPAAEVPIPGRSGASNGGPTSGDVRILATFDYAVNTHFLTGARIGYVAQSYPGAAAGNDGHGLSAPIHLELRETYLFGTKPLARSGFAPYLFASLGYAKADASQVSFEQVGVTGSRPVVVWRLGGPFFVAAGGGARYAFSPRVAFLAGIKAALPFGTGGVLPSLAPEVALQYGF